MKQTLLQLLAVALLLAPALGREPAPKPRLMPKAPVLPLALDDSIQFRKSTVFLNDPQIWKATQEDMISFERQRVNFGAVTNFDRQQRYGFYYHFFWRTLRPVDRLTVRFEYRQEKLGAYVQAQEHEYTKVRGNVESSFQVTGDDYNEDGKVTAWRCIIIQDGKIVALNQSYLWR